MERWHHASDREAILIIERLNVYDVEEISEEELKDFFNYIHDRLHGHFKVSGIIDEDFKTAQTSCSTLAFLCLPASFQSFRRHNGNPDTPWENSPGRRNNGQFEVDRQGSNCFLFQVNLKSYHTRYQTKQRNQLVGIILVVTCSIFVLLGKWNLLEGICIAAKFEPNRRSYYINMFRNHWWTSQSYRLQARWFFRFSVHIIFLVFSSRSHNYVLHSNIFCSKLPKSY